MNTVYLYQCKALAYLLTVLTLFVGSATADESALFSTVLVWQGSGRVIVSENSLEPRSIGSFSIRFYGGRNSDFPFDDFQVGAIFERDGVIESVQVVDIDGDNQDDLVVVLRTVGSGAYRNVDAFSIGLSEIVRMGSVSGVAPDADPIELLKQPFE
ncbi:MAG: PliI family lysozyme inhibitor of I-type lysozyme [Halioglobus sp.]